MSLKKTVSIGGIFYRAVQAARLAVLRAKNVRQWISHDFLNTSGFLDIANPVLKR